MIISDFIKILNWTVDINPVQLFQKDYYIWIQHSEKNC